MKRRLEKVVKRIFYKMGCHISRCGHFPFFDLLLDACLRNNNAFFFIQIGANDGKTLDPIYEFVTTNQQNVRGIAIEPVKDYFKQLKRNYQKYPNVIVLNAAIHNSQQEMTVYKVDPTRQNDLPKWTKMIASFNRDHHKLSGTPMDAIIQEKVRCMSLNDLLKNYHVGRIDLLQIDTEGYDSEIILNIDFKVIKPAIIHFEHGLSDGIMSKETFVSLTDMLHENGYELWVDSYDATAYQRNILIGL